MSSTYMSRQPQSDSPTKRASLALSLSGCVILAGASAALAAESMVDGWTIKPFVIDGRFDRCNANAPSRDLAVVLFKDGRLSALVADRDGAYQDAQIDVDVDLDGRIMRQVPAAVVADQLFLVALGSGQATIDRLSKASTLRIMTSAKTYTFDLVKLGKPLVALQKCVAEAGSPKP